MTFEDTGSSCGDYLEKNRSLLAIVSTCMIHTYAIHADRSAITVTGSQASNRRREREKIKTLSNSCPRALVLQGKCASYAQSKSGVCSLAFEFHAMSDDLEHLVSLSKPRASLFALRAAFFASLPLSSCLSRCSCACMQCAWCTFVLHAVCCAR